ncbi:hypothetical protein RN06_2950 [Mycobacterium tuberculosis variant bovis BCG]|nr:hypothetical protein RN06_2950 [Mycobacterium tuberculosis variant bovis BCG]
MRRVSLPNQLNETRRRSPTRGERIFGGYNTSDVYAMAFDEMFDAQGIVRGPYKGIYAELAPSDASELKARADALGRAFIDQGITFSLSGQERPFPLDLVPRVISAPSGPDWNVASPSGSRPSSATSTTSMVIRRFCATVSSRAGW